MKYALISITNKDNLGLLVKGLKKHDFQIIATTSSAVAIKEIGYDCLGIEDIASFPEILGGRVKTLQPQIHGGILADLSNPQHLEDLKHHQINPISLVVCNLYEFEKICERESKLLENKDSISDTDIKNMKKNIIEGIDIGGVTLIRAASKNFEHVSLLCDPNDYQDYLKHLDEDSVNYEYNNELATKGFIHTANYDSMIANFFDNGATQLLVSAQLKRSLRYGENPYQKANYFENDNTCSYSLSSSTLLQGKELSYNNILDIDAAFNSIYGFKQPVAIAFKHNTPCSFGYADDIYQAYLNAYECDTTSIFGGIVIFNRKVDEKLALKLNELFLEVIIAPDYDVKALEVFSKKVNLRIVKGDFNEGNYHSYNVRNINGGYLVQDSFNYQDFTLETKTSNGIAQEILTSLEMLYRVVKPVKSNGIVIGDDKYVLGICGGMVSRIDACAIAMSKAKLNKLYNNQPLFLASDGFFPFDDIVDFALEHNIKYIIQPGGSINDDKIIKRCNDNGIGMVFTNIRYFKH